MNLSLLLTHFIVLFSIASSTAIAAPLCREVLAPPTDNKTMDTTLDDLAKMKLQIDVKKLQGHSTSMDRQFEDQFFKKKLELQRHFKLSEQEIVNILREKISRLQSSENETSKKEKQRETQVRAQEDKIINPWLKTKILDLPDSIEVVEAKYTSEKHQVAIHTFDKSPQELALIDFKTGKTTTYKNKSTISDLIVPKNSDVVILTTADGLMTFNLVSKEFKPWDKVNEWRNTVEGSEHKIKKQFSTMTPDQKYLAHIIHKKDSNFAALIEIATGKVVRTKELENSDQFTQYAMMLNETKLAISSPLGLHIYDFKKDAYYVLNTETTIDTITRTDNKRALIGDHAGFTYRFDLANHDVIKSEYGQEFLAADSDYVWRLDVDGNLERLRVHDLSVVEQETPSETQFYPKIYPIKSGLVLGVHLKDDVPVAIYDSHTLQPVFEFHGQFMNDAIIPTSAAVIRDGTQILIEYYINDQQKLEIWDLNK